MRKFVLMAVAALILAASAFLYIQKKDAEASAPKVWEDRSVYYILLNQFNDGDKKNNSPDFSGDIKGLIRKLDYIRGMGFTALQISPPTALAAENNSVFSTQNPKLIESRYGNEDFYHRLIQEAHKRGMLVIQDIGLIDTNKMNSGTNSVYATNSDLIHVYKDAYNYWVSTSGIDGYSIPFSSSIPHPFWKELLLGSGGILSAARHQSKPNYFINGMAEYYSSSGQTAGEQKINGYFKDGFSAMQDYPLATDIRDVFGNGKSTTLLADRLVQRDSIYESRMMTTFVDNPFTSRFSTFSKTEDLKLALTFLYTIPGVPVVLYGTEQNFTNSGKGVFKTSSPVYKLIRSLSVLRSHTEALRNGKITPVFSEPTGSGILAFTIESGDKSYLAVFNTDNQPRYASGIRLRAENWTVLKPVFSLTKDIKNLVYNQTLNLRVPEKGMILYEITADKSESGGDGTFITMDSLNEGQIYDDMKSDFLPLDGTASNVADIEILVDGVEKPAVTTNLSSEDSAHWFANLHITDYPVGIHRIVARGITKDKKIVYSDTYTAVLSFIPIRLGDGYDAYEDDKGPSGFYLYPTNLTYMKKRTTDIISVETKKLGSSLAFKIKMNSLITNNQVPFGFQDVSFQIYLTPPDTFGTTGAKDMPFQKAAIPYNRTWVYSIWVDGWTANAYSYKNSGINLFGNPVRATPVVSTEISNKMIVISIPFSAIGITDVTGWKAYITTWDSDPETGALLPLAQKPDNSSFGGGDPSGAKIMDDIWVELVQPH